MMQFHKQAALVIQEVGKAVYGKDECLAKIMTAILAGGHILIEDIPGVGKTTIALSFSRAMALEQHRMQFTPDVLPADIVGFSMYNKESKTFVYQPGAIMCNFFLADEINRASAKTQSAFLEVMEEKTVTIDGVTRPLPQPFIVMATQNPIGSAGTQLLPESQLDRFMLCLSIGYPNMENEIEIVKQRSYHEPADLVSQVIDDQMLIAMKKEVENIFIHDEIYRYMGRLVESTRNHALIELGVSPRGTIAIAKMARARAFLMGREYVLPEDVVYVIPGTITHRLRLHPKARVNQMTKEMVTSQILDTAAPPTVRRSKR